MDNANDFACDNEVIIGQILQLWLHCVHLIINSCW
jgi:hypothetical protein